MSSRSGSSETMLSRIRASTRAISRATPKSNEPATVAVPIRAILWSYLTVSGEQNGWSSGRAATGREEAHRRKGTADSGPAGADAHQLHGGSRSRVTVPRDAPNRRRDRLKERVDHVIPIADPVRHHHDGHH